jgi:hypothetical protein
MIHLVVKNNDINIEINLMSKLIVFTITPLAIMVIMLMACGVLIFDFIYELFVNLLRSEDDRDW